jgi:uncharacterized membrane protein YhfC
MNPLFLLCGVGMMAVAFVAVVYWKVRSKVLWRLFAWGALVWIVGVAVKVIASIPNQAIIDAARGALPKYFAEPLLWLYIGLLTGVFECGATLVFAHIRRIRSADYNEVVAFGLGFGAVEAFLVGLASFVMILLVVLVPNKLPEEMVKYMTSGAGSPLVIPAPIVERITAVLLHAFSCVLIVYAVRTRAWRWFWAAFWYKTAMDAIAGLLHLENLLADMFTLGMWVVELILLPFGLVGLWGLWRFRKRWQQLDRNTEIHPPVAGQNPQDAGLTAD